MTAVLDRPAAPASSAVSPQAHWRPDRLGRWVLGLAVVAVVVAVRLYGLADGPAYADDEGTYAAQAWSVVHQGALAPYTYWYDHPPLGWLVLAAWTWISGPFLHAPTAVLGGRYLMVVLSGVDALLLLAAGRRLGLRWWAAGTAALLWGLSPLAIGYSRGVWLDNVGATFLLGALVCALSPRRHLWAYAGSGFLLACAVLSKETLVLVAPAVVLAAYRTSAGRTRVFCLSALGGTAVLMLLAYPLFSVLKGELFPGPGHVSLLEALQFQLGGRASTGSPLDPSSASAGLVGQWLHRDPWLLGAGVLLTPLALAVGRLRVPALAVAVPVLVGLRPGYLPEPYVIALLPFCALLVAGLLHVALGTVPSRGLRTALPLVAAAGLVALLAVPWRDGAAALAQDRATSRALAVESVVAHTVPHQSRVLVDDSIWVDLVDRGFNPHLGVIWFYKTDFTGGLDPSVRRALPDGYRDVQWVVVSPIMRSALDQNPGGLGELRRAISHSRLVHTVGTGSARYELRKVQP